MRTVVRRYPGARLLIAGRGDAERARASWSATDLRASVALLGELSEADKAAFLRSVDVYCAPNLLGESFGVVLIEALAAGAPIVASDLDAFARVLEDGAAGVLVRRGDAARPGRRPVRAARRPRPAGRALGRRRRRGRRATTGRAGPADPRRLRDRGAARRRRGRPRGEDDETFPAVAARGDAGASIRRGGRRTSLVPRDTRAPGCCSPAVLVSCCSSGRPGRSPGCAGWRTGSTRRLDGAGRPAAAAGRARRGAGPRAPGRRRGRTAAGGLAAAAAGAARPPRRRPGAGRERCSAASCASCRRAWPACRRRCGPT